MINIYTHLVRNILSETPEGKRMVFHHQVAEEIVKASVALYNDGLLGLDTRIMPDVVVHLLNKDITIYSPSEHTNPDMLKMNHRYRIRIDSDESIPNLFIEFDEKVLGVSILSTPFADKDFERVEKLISAKKVLIHHTSLQVVIDELAAWVEEVIRARLKKVGIYHRHKQVIKMMVENTEVPVDITNTLSNLYQETEAVVFLTSSQKLLDGKRPIDLIKRGEKEKVLELLHQISDGTYS